MTVGRMHDDELAIDEPLVRSLLGRQFPRWANLRLERVRSAGTDNALYRLGDGLVVRIPRIAGAATSIEKEHAWLPRLAPSLPLAVPEPVALGEPDEGYPWRWSVYRWLDGEALDASPIVAPLGFAETLGAFVSALHAIDPTDGPPPGEHNGWRGAPLASRDAEFRDALAACAGIDGVDVPVVAAEWDAALEEPDWDRDPVWVHGDLLPTNLLALDGRLRGVIDFGALGIGEPACDMLPAWTTLPPNARATYRAAIDVDEATWMRGRAWALSWAVIALPYYLHTNPTLAAIARRTIDAVLAQRERLTRKLGRWRPTAPRHGP
jgi:aminoglycoside phosphotransferase (APT) family kinase protein